MPEVADKNFLSVIYVTKAGVCQAFGVLLSESVSGIQRFGSAGSLKDRYCFQITQDRQNTSTLRCSGSP